MLAVTGGAALAVGAKLTGSNNQISGAFGLSDTTNTTTASVDGSAIDGFDDVSVEGASNGSRIGAGLSLSADATQTTDGAVVAASVSMLIANDGASATVTGGDITGPTGGAGAVNVLAYDGLLMGAGAGGLSFGSSNSVGAAATVVLVNSPHAADAELNGTAVSNYAGLTVQGLDGARIAGVSAAAAVKGGTSSRQRRGREPVVQRRHPGLDGGGQRGYGGDRQYRDLRRPGHPGRRRQPVHHRGRGLGRAQHRNPRFGLLHRLQLQHRRSGRRQSGQCQRPDGRNPDPVAGDTVRRVGRDRQWGRRRGLLQQRQRRPRGLADGRRDQQCRGRIAIGAVRRLRHHPVPSPPAPVSARRGRRWWDRCRNNAIGGTSSATVGGASASSPLSLTVGTTGADPGSTANLAVGVTGNGHIYSLSGALGFSDGSAGALALSYNDITPNLRSGRHAQRPGRGPARGPRLCDPLRRPEHPGDRQQYGRQSSASRSPGCSATARGPHWLARRASTPSRRWWWPRRRTSITRTITKGGLAIQASDGSTIQSLAASLAVSAGSNGAPGVAINTIGSEVYAGLAETGTSSNPLAVNVGDLLVQADESASTTALRRRTLGRGVL